MLAAATAATRRELDKVKLESKKPSSSRREPDSGSETESDVTELGEDEDEPEYYPGTYSRSRARECRRVAALACMQARTD